MLDKSLIGLVLRSQRVKSAHQISTLRDAGAEWIVEIGKDCPNWRTAVRAVRDDDTVYIYALSFLPTKRGGDKLSPTAQVADFLLEVHERGGVVVEVHTGRKSNNRKDRQGMIDDAHKALKRGTRALPSTGRERGRPKNEWTKEQVDKAKKVWFCRDYVTNTAAARHLPKGMTARHCWNLFGASGRPYKQKHKQKRKK